MVETSESRFRLLLHLIAYEIRRRYVGTTLGVAWSVVQPLLVLGAFFFLFTVLRVTNRAPHGALGEVAIILSGLVPWYFFIHSFSEGLGTLDQHAPLVKQINFPVEILPFVTVGVSLLEYGVGLSLLIALTIAEGWIGWSGLVLIPLSVLTIIWFAGMAAVLAPLGAMLRDLRMLLPLIVRLGLWVSPVLYLPGTIQSHLRWVLYANPLSYLIGVFRYGAFGNAFGSRVLLLPLAASIGVVAALSMISLVVGTISWRYVRRVAVDYL